MNSGSDEARARLWLLAAVSAVAIGVLVAGTVSRGVGGVLTVAGWAFGIFALHTFGRLGRSSSRVSSSSAPRASHSIPSRDEANESVARESDSDSE